MICSTLQARSLTAGRSNRTMVDWGQERNGNCSVRSICNRQDFLEAELAVSS